MVRNHKIYIMYVLLQNLSVLDLLMPGTHSRILWFWDQIQASVFFKDSSDEADVYQSLRTIPFKLWQKYKLSCQGEIPVLYIKNTGKC